MASQIECKMAPVSSHVVKAPEADFVIAKNMKLTEGSEKLGDVLQNLTFDAEDLSQLQLTDARNVASRLEAFIRASPGNIALAASDKDGLVEMMLPVKPDETLSLFIPLRVWSKTKILKLDLTLVTFK